MADGNNLKQALVNIMQNAMEAMVDEGTLTVRTWLHAELNMLVVAIADTGVGIGQEILPRAFEPFYTTKLDRMGLGLPIAHRIVSEHGGFINISADEVKGTKVHVYLPINDDRIRRLTVVHQQILNLQ
jgi:two-component system sensor histidine kinase AtoS